jgi:hypothetical protein
MEEKMIKYIFLLLLAILTVACCDDLCKGEKLCNQINPNNVSALNNYDICGICRRNDLYTIYNSEVERKIILSLKNNRFYYKNYYPIKDSVEINAIVDVLRIIDKYEIYELWIRGTSHYYIFYKGDMMVNGATKYVSEHPNGIKIKDDWYYYEKESQ